MILNRFFGLTFAASAAVALASCSTSTPISSLLPDSAEPTFYKHLDAREARVDPVAARDMVSIYRRNKGLATVAIDPQLQKVAERQALAMASADALSHTVRGDLQSRLDGAGVRHSAAVENVSAGYHTLAEAFSGWRQSPHHNENMLNPRMRRMGIATAYAPGSKYKVFWALVMTD
jgi:uncharacterized protein YkwD